MGNYFNLRRVRVGKKLEHPGLVALGKRLADLGEGALTPRSSEFSNASWLEGAATGLGCARVHLAGLGKRWGSLGTIEAN